MKNLSVRSWISIVTFALIGVILFFSRKELAHAWTLVGRVDLWILVLLIPAIVAGYLASGEMVFSYLRQKHLIKDVSIWTQARMSLELNFVNHILPSGGVSGVSYMNWRLAKYGVPTGKATMAQAVKYVAGFASLIVLLIVAVLLVTIDGQLNRWIILMSSTLVTVMIAVTIGGIYLMSNPPRMHRVAQRISRGCNKIVRKLTFGQVEQVIKPSKVVEFLDDMSDDYESMMRDKRVLLQPFLWGLFFTATEVAIFWIVFWSLGSPVNPAPILIAYGLASLAAFAIVTPGGAGAYEAIMVLVLAVAGMPKGEAIAGIVLTRAIVLAVTIVVGWIFYQLVVMKHGKRPDADI